MPRLTAAFALALGLALTAPAAAAAPPGAVLGGEGELFAIEQGLYGELMGRPHAPEAENSVLVLRIQRPDRQDELHPLPSTLGPDVESAAALLYEEASDTLFVAWQTLANVHSQIRMAGFSDGAWGEPIDVSDRRFSFKSDPRLAVTRDAFEGRDAGGEPVMVKRTVLHVVWVEERADQLAVVYSPVILLGGAFDATRPGPIFTLTELVTPAPEHLLASPLFDLPLRPTVEAGADNHSVVVGFVHPASGRLVTLDLSMLSGDISALADGAGAHLIQTGAEVDTSDPDELAALADGTRAHIIQTGNRLDPRVLSFVAGGTRAHIIQTGADYDLSREGGLRSLADETRAHIIQTGVRFEDRGLRHQSTLAEALVLDLHGEEGAPSHQIGLNVVADRSLDGLAAGDDPLLLLSPSGADALIAWEAEGQLRYQESRDQGWSDVRAISLAAVERVRAYEVIDQRIRNR